MKCLSAAFGTCLLGGSILMCASFTRADTTPQLPDDRVQQVLNVDGAAAAASDNGTGGEKAPFKTLAKGIAAARDNAAKGIACKVLVAPGT
jgi:hypothetical protein